MMFTPQRKVWSGWRSPQNNGNNSTGKNVAFDEPVTLNTGIGVNLAVDRDVLVQKITALENELHEYQYNMGLLLIEKKEWTSKYEVLHQSLAEINDALNREETSHLVAISDVEKREDNLRKALGVEKQCVLDLEKALHEMRSEHAEIKFTADSRLAEANALVTSIEERSLEVEAKLHAADAKLAEVSRKSAEIERKAQEIESHEIALRRDRSSFDKEREAHETVLSRQREDLREWERKLQESEERLDESQRILNQREERSNENDNALKQREEALEQAETKIDFTNLSLKTKEDDYNHRLANLTLKENDYEATGKRLEMKEKDLLTLEAKLDEREKVEMEKLLNEHNSVLEANKHECELELAQKRKSVDDDLKNKVVEVDRKETEVNHMEQKIVKKEKALEKKMQNFKEKETNFESKVKDLKDMEKFIKAEEKKIEVEKKQVLVDRDVLENLKCDVEKIRADIEEQKFKILEEKQQLAVTEEERSEIVRLKSELKRQRDNCRLQEQLVLKEAEDLKKQRNIFERDWEELDMKRVELENDLKDVIGQKEKFQKLKHIEEESLEKKNLETQEYMKKEREALKLTEEAFAATMQNEKSVFLEKIQSEKSQLNHDFELRKDELESSMLKRQEEMEKDLLEKEKLFEVEKERELNNIYYLKEVARGEKEEMELEKSVLEKDKEEFAANQKHLKAQQLELQKDIDQLVVLSNKLKVQREQFVVERDQFIAFVEKHKSCNNCGEITRKFMLSDLRSLPEIENINTLPRLAGDFTREGIQGNSIISGTQIPEEVSPCAGAVGSSTPGRSISLFKYCTSKIFNTSPVKKIEHAAFDSPKGELNISEKQVNIIMPVEKDNEPELSFGIASDFFYVHDPSIEDQNEDVNGNAEKVSEDYGHTNLKGGTRNRNKRGRPRVINRTRSVKAVVEEAKSILGQGLEDNENVANGNFVNSHGESSLADKGELTKGRKRSRFLHTSQTTTASEQDGGDGDSEEGHSYKVVAGGRKKRRQEAVPAGQIPSQQRYNLRRRKVAVHAAEARSSSDLNRREEEEHDVSRGSWKMSKCNVDPTVSVPSPGVASDNGGSKRFEKFEKAADTRDSDTHIVAEKLAASVALSEEVNETSERAEDYEDEGDECKTESNGDDDGDEEEDDDESVLPGEASIGKKLWTFFTT